MNVIMLFDGPGDDEAPDAVVTFDSGCPESVAAAREAIAQRHGVDLGPLLERKASWIDRLLGRGSTPPGEAPPP